MKAVQVSQYGGPEVLQLADIDCPEPAAGEVRIRLQYAGINFRDLCQRKGLHASSDSCANSLPFTIGSEGSGTIDALGAGVQGWAVGERVAYCLTLGSYAEYACVPAWRLLKIPEGVSRKVATTLMLQGCTAHYLTHSLFRLQPGHSCLVHAASGGVGQLLVQIAKLRGAQVFAAVSSKDKAEVARTLGADDVLVYGDEPFAEVVRRETGGDGVDVVYDPVGKDTIADSIRSCKRRGTVCNFGSASGAVASIAPLALAQAGSVFFTRPQMTDYMRDAQEVSWRGNEMLELAMSGALHVQINQVLALADAEQAHRISEERATTGKLLLSAH